jgi:MFS family permease
VSRSDVEAPVPTLAPLAVPAYRRIWGAAVVSHLGTFLQMTAAPWLMLELTGSAFLVSLVTAFLLLPRLLLTLPAGALADVVDRRTLLIVGNLIGSASVGAMALLAMVDRLTPFLILVLTLALGSGSALAMPAFQTLVPDLVPRPLLPQAITLNSGAFNMARAVGPAIGGALIAAGLAALSFGLNALSFLVVVGVLFTLPRDQVERAVTSPRSLLRATVIGVRYARFTPTIRTLLLITTMFTLTTASVQALLAPAAVELGLGGTGFGVLWGVFGIGALVGVGYRERMRIRLGRYMVPASMMLFGVGGLLFGLVPVPVIAGIGLFLAGISWVWVMITLNATIQLLAPTWVRSRVVALYALVVGLQPVGAMLAGAIAEQTTSLGAIAVTTAVTLGAGIAALRLDIPVLGRIEEPELAGLEILDELREVDVTGPVIVRRIWHVTEPDIEEFLVLIREARAIRRRVGARAWELHRDAIEVGIFTEVVHYADWQEHLFQRTRLTTEDLTVLGRLRQLDVDGAPRTRLLVPVDL